MILTFYLIHIVCCEIIPAQEPSKCPNKEDSAGENLQRTSVVSLRAEATGLLLIEVNCIKGRFATVWLSHACSRCMRKSQYMYLSSGATQITDT